jgi:Flp pilus assembly protein TadD
MKKFLLLLGTVLIFTGCPSSWKNAAKIHITGGRFELAKTQCLIGTKTVPIDFEAYTLLAQCELGLANSAAAAVAFREGIKVDSAKTIDWILRDVQNKELYWQTFYGAAVANVSADKLGEALADLALAKLIDPTNVNAYVLEGLVYIRQGKKDEANAAYNKAIEIDPESPEPYFRIGTSYFEKKSYDTALVYLEKAKAKYSTGYETARKTVFSNIEFKPDVALQIYRLWNGQKNEELDQLVKKVLGFDAGLEGQRRNLERFVKSSTGLAGAYYYIGMTRLNQKKDTLALENLSAALALSPDDLDALYFSGEVLISLKDWTGAKERFERVTALKKDDVVAWFYVGVCYMQLKDYRKAASVYEDEVLKLDPKNLDAYTNLAICYREMGDTKKAMEYLQKKEKIIKGQ